MWARWLSRIRLLSFNHRSVLKFIFIFPFWGLRPSLCHAATVKTPSEREPHFLPYFLSDIYKPVSMQVFFVRSVRNIAIKRLKTLCILYYTEFLAFNAFQCVIAPILRVCKNLCKKIPVKVSGMCICISSRNLSWNAPLCRQAKTLHVNRCVFASKHNPVVYINLADVCDTFYSS
jgi:hypothetical protein